MQDFIINTINNNKQGPIHNLVNIDNCDSTVTLDLSIINTDSIHTLSVTACDTFTYDGNIYLTTGIYYRTLSNFLGCDSIISISLTINNSSTSI